MDLPAQQPLTALLVALGAGLLIGIEREQRKGSGPQRSFAGVRTFTLAALAGAAVALIGQPLLIAVGALLVGAFAVVAYWRDRSDDPGVTTEVALFVTYLIGVWAYAQPVWAASVAVIVATLLAARSRLHRFSVEVLSEAELHDALLLAGAALVVLPLLPDRAIGPFEAFNPYTIWRLVVLVMAINAAGYIAVRLFGARIGLPLAGLAAGFVSSLATIASMGSRARAEPARRNACVSGAVLSTIATFVQMALIVVAIHPPSLVHLALPLGAGTVAATLYALIVMWRDWRGARTATSASGKGRDSSAAPAGHTLPGRAFRLSHALGFAAMVATVMLLVAAVQAWFGSTGLWLGAALAGFADAHASSASAVALAASGRIEHSAVVLPVLAALTTNTVSKIVAAYVTGGAGYAVRVVPGLLLVAAAIWAAALIPVP